MLSYPLLSKNNATDEHLFKCLLYFCVPDFTYNFTEIVFQFKLVQITVSYAYFKRSYSFYI